MRETLMENDRGRPGQNHHYDTRRRRGSDMTPETRANDLHKDFKRVFSFSHELPVLHREPTDLRLAKHQPLPAIGMSSLPETLDDDEEEEDRNEINQQSSRFISPPSPTFILPPKRQSKMDVDSPKTRRTKAKLNINNVRRKRFEPRRATAGVQLPPLKRSTRQWPGSLNDSFDSDYMYEIPERPEAPAPNRTPPLEGGHCLSLDDDEPIDYIDED